MDNEREIQIRITAKNLTADEFAKARAGIAGLSEEVDRSRRRTRESTQDAGLFGQAWKAAGAAIAAAGIGTALIGLAKNAISTASEIKDTAGKLDIGTEAVQRFKFGLEQTGGTFPAFESALVKMNDNLANGSKSTIGALTTAGLKFSEIRQMKPEDAFRAIASAIGKIPDPMQQTQVALELFGKSGAELLPSIREGFLNVADGAKVMSDDTIQRLADAQDAWESLANSVTIWTGEIIAGFARDIPAAASGWSKFFGDLKASAGGLFTGGLAGAAAAHEEYMVQLGQQLEAEHKAAEETKKLAEEKQKLARSSAAAAARHAQYADAAKAAADAQRKYNEEIKKGADALTGVARAAEIARTAAIVQRALADGGLKDAEAYRALVKQVDAWREAGVKLPPVLDQVGRTQLRVNTQIGDAKKFLDDLKASLGPAVQLWRDYESAVGLAGLNMSTFPVTQGAPDFSQLGQALPPMQPPPGYWDIFGKGAQDELAAAALRFPDMLADAIINGGDVGRALEAWSTQLAGNIGQKFGKSLSGMLGAGGFLGDLITGGMGALFSVGANLLIKAGEKLFGNATKKGREQFAESMGFGNLAGLYDDLRKLGAEGERLANIGLNVVGRNDEAANRRWMEDVRKFYADIEQEKQQLDNDISSLGLTDFDKGDKGAALQKQITDLLAQRERLKKAGFDEAAITQAQADKWSALYQAAKKYNLEIPPGMRAVFAELQAQGLLLDANGNKVVDLTGKFQEQMGELADSIKETQQQIDGLYAQIADEAPEEVAGVVETQIRAQIAALEQQRDAQQQQYDELAAAAQDSADEWAKVHEEAAKKFYDDTTELFERGIKLPVYFETPDGYPPLPGGPLPPRAAVGGVFEGPGYVQIEPGRREMIGDPDFMGRAIDAAMARRGGAMSAGSVSITIDARGAQIDSEARVAQIADRIIQQLPTHLRQNRRGVRTKMRASLGVS